VFPHFPVADDGRASRGRPDTGRREPARPALPAIELEGLRARAREEGFAAGVREGREAAHAEWADRLRAAVRSLEEAGRDLLARRVDLAAEVDRQLPRVVLLLTRRILGRELGTADTAARTVLRSLAADLAGLGTPVALRLEPRAAEAVAAWRHGEPAEASALAGVRIEPDPALGPGEWIVETHDGFLDGRIEARLEEAWRLLTELPG
jgi:flagellar assembly protein FliH